MRNKKKKKQNEAKKQYKTKEAKRSVRNKAKISEKKFCEGEKAPIYFHF
jgi:hypothetical protein